MYKVIEYKSCKSYLYLGYGQLTHLAKNTILNYKYFEVYKGGLNLRKFFTLAAISQKM